jgi:RNA polymerase sigma-70 factor (ECF subfamily)
MYAIARRVRIDQYRRKSRSSEHEVQTEQLPEMAAPESRFGSSPDITDLLATLPAAQREVILLLKVSGLTLEEVARATGTSVGAVKQKAHRAYEKLRKLFGGDT